MRAERRAEGHAVGRDALRTGLRRSGLRALSTRPQRPRTTVAGPTALAAENLLFGQPAPRAPHQVGVGDIPSLPLVGGRGCYRATGREACSRRVVGWHRDAHRPTEWVLTALEQALTLHQPSPGVIIHADRGRQDTSAARPQRMIDAGGLPGFSRPGNPDDNA